MIDRPECAACRIGRAASQRAERCPLARTARRGGFRLFSAGEEPDALYYVRAGEILLTGGEAPDEERPRAIRPAGSVLGIECLRGEPHALGARSAGAVELCVLPRSKLQAWVGRAPEVARALLDAAVEELQRTRREESELRLACEARLARFLLRRRGAGGRAPLRKTTVAALLGMRPETLSRCAARLAARGAIDAALSVRDEASLRAAART